MDSKQNVKITRVFWTYQDMRPISITDFQILKCLDLSTLSVLFSITSFITKANFKLLRQILGHLWRWQLILRCQNSEALMLHPF